MSVSRDQMIDYISDTYKEAFGVRPRHYDWNAMSDEELGALADDVTDSAQRAIWEEESYIERCVKEFEESISASILSGAADRKTAIRWIFQATDDHGSLFDAEQFCFERNLPFSMAKEIWESVQ